MTCAGQKKINVCWWIWGLAVLLLGALDGAAQSTQSVTLAWSASPDPSVTGYTLYYGTNSGVYANSLTVGSQTSATLTGLQAGTTYYIIVVAFNGAGLESAPSNEVGYQVPGNPSNSPTPPVTGTGGNLSSSWQMLNLGNVGMAGNLTQANDLFTVQGAGSLGGLADNCFFAFQALNGDGEIRVHLNTKSPLAANGAVGLMMRESTKPGSTSVFLGLAANGSLLWQYRAQTGGNAISVYAAPNAWLRLVRTGNGFTGYSSADGKTWNLVALCTVVMAPNVNLGFAVASGTVTTLATAAFDNVSINGASTSSSPVVNPPPVTAAPTITLTGPTTGTAALAPATINLAASITANGHTISAVQFYNGTTLLGQDTATPYTFAWNNVAAGNYSLSAKLVYDSTSTLDSTAVTVTVTNSLAAPTIVLTTPTTGTAALAPATFNLAAGVTANGHSVSAVQFFNGTTLLGQANTAPYTFTWNNVAAGNYSLSAKLVYDSTSTLDSTVVTVTVTNSLAAPTIVLTAPTTGTAALSPATINLAASVTANGHTISAVQFYNDTTLLGQDTATPYTLAWNNVAAGTYTISARLVYDSTSTLASSTVTVTVTNAPVSTPTNAAAAPLPLPWQTMNVGTASSAGNAAMTDGVVTIQGAGNLGGLADNFFFAYQSLSGDGDISVHLNSNGSLTAPGGAAGIMIRDNLTAGAGFAFLGVSPTGNLTWQYRSRTAIAPVSLNLPPSNWLRLTRKGIMLNSYISNDGLSWTPAGNGIVTMAANAYIGLAVASGSANPTTFGFDTIAITP